MPKSVHRVPADRQALQGFDHVVQPRGQPARAHDHPGPSGIQFFAGSADDPFFFDIPGFNRFVASVLAGAANPALLQRGRDSFAGYNTLVIAFSFPVSFFGPIRNNVLGATARVFNPSVTDPRWRQIDRVATPGVNVGFVPLNLDDVQNRSSTVENTSGADPGCHRRDPPGARDQRTLVSPPWPIWSSRAGISCASTPPSRTPGRAAVITPAPVSPTAGAPRMM